MSSNNNQNQPNPNTGTHNQQQSLSENQRSQVHTLNMQSTDKQTEKQMPASEVRETMRRDIENNAEQFDPQKEQAVMASFADPDVAQRASNELQSMGIQTVQIDRVSRYPGNPTQKLMNPLTGNIPSHADLVLGMDNLSSRDVGVLLGADPSVSGFSTTVDDDVTSEDILMTVVCPKDQVEKVVQVIKSHGGNT